jgi:predicted aspartyl protease
VTRAGRIRAAIRAGTAVRAGVLCGLAVLLAGCPGTGAPARVDAPVDAAAGEVALGTVGHNEAALVVPVHINGQGPFDLVLDTGATLTCVTTELAQRLGLPDRTGAVAYGAGVQSAGRLRIVEIDSLRVGNASAHGATGCVIDLDALQTVGADVDGLLGLSFLREFDVRLDFRRGVMTLTAGDG